MTAGNVFRYIHGTIGSPANEYPPFNQTEQEPPACEIERQNPVLLWAISTSGYLYLPSKEIPQPGEGIRLVTDAVRAELFTSKELEDRIHLLRKLLPKRNFMPVSHRSLPVWYVRDQGTGEILSQHKNRPFQGITQPEATLLLPRLKPGNYDVLSAITNPPNQ